MGEVLRPARGALGQSGAGETKALVTHRARGSSAQGPQAGGERRDTRPAQTDHSQAGTPLIGCQAPEN